MFEDWQFYTIIFLAGAYVARQEYEHKDLRKDIKRIMAHIGIDNGKAKGY